MRVAKRNGGSEPVDLNKIVRAVQRCCEDLYAIDPMRVATRTISGLYDGASTRELDELSIRTAALLTAEEPEYGRLAARLLAGVIAKEVAGQEIHAFSQSIARGFDVGLINERLLGFVQANARKLNDALDASLDRHFDYFGLRTLYDRYLLRHPHTRKVIETPQQFFLRIACALSADVPEALALYRRMGNLDYLPSSPTLFNSGTTHEQLSSCFLLDSPQDSLESIYQRYGDIAQLSKFSGGIGLSYTRVRSRGSLIRSTNGHSNGIVPWLKTLDSSVAAVNQGGKRKGAACVYLEPWHADIEEFLELRDNTGDEARRTHNLNLANWIPDLFMRRVEADGDWSLFDPHVGAGFHRPVRRRFRPRLRTGRGAGQGDQDDQGARAVRAHDAHAGADRQRLDDVQGQVQPRQQPDRQARQRHPSVEPVHRDPRGDLARGNRGLQSRLDQPGAAFRRRRPRRYRRVRFRQARRDRAPGRAPARPRHRPQLLSDRIRAPRQPALATGRARRDGIAGRVLQAAPAVRQRAGARLVAQDRRDDLLPRACRPRSNWPRNAAGIRRSPTRARPTASCSSMPGASCRNTPSAGTRCATASANTACATRC